MWDFRRSISYCRSFYHIDWWIFVFVGWIWSVTKMNNESEAYTGTSTGWARGRTSTGWVRGRKSTVFPHMFCYIKLRKKVFHMCNVLMSRSLLILYIHLVFHLFVNFRLINNNKKSQQFINTTANMESNFTVDGVKFSSPDHTVVHGAQ